MDIVNLNDRTTADTRVASVEAAVWQAFDDIAVPGAEPGYADGHFLIFPDGSSISVKITVEKGE